MVQIQSSGLDWVRQVGEKLAQYLLKQGEHVTYKHHGHPFHTDFGELYRFIFITMGHNHYAIDFNDTDKSQLDDSGITKVLKCQYNPLVGYHNTVPYTYFPKNPNLLQSMLHELRSINRIYPLYFKGKAHGKRDDILVVLDYNFDLPLNEVSNIQEYYRECAAAKVCLSLPGHGNFCHREIECFAMGVPVLMPVLVNQCHNRLIPNEHYISIDCNYYRDSAVSISKKIIERYGRITPEELDTVVINARKWYEENVMFPNSIQLALQLLY